jgi:anthraniloyl-CoA monooxygenase
VRIVSIGGGPAGLFLAVLVKRAQPDASVTVLERNARDDTFGWGVVFSREALGTLGRADPATMDRVGAHLRAWDDVEVRFRGEVIRSTGHGFAGLSRRTLLAVLHDRCRELGVEIRFEHEASDVEAVRGRADLVLGADGAHSAVRARYADRFAPRIEQGRCKFCWLGTDLRLDAFTFAFEENEHGLFQAHAYPYAEDRSTWIVECHEETFRRAGLDGASEADTVRYCEALFRRHLGGARLLGNRSIWRSFPVVQNARWHHENVVLLGDAAHTAHFSIGSGTKLAMEDAVALASALARHAGDVPRALAAYQAEREGAVLRVQRVAEASRGWFEHAARFRAQDPLAFAFNLLTRSRRIGYDSLARRDPALVGRVAARFAGTADGPAPRPSSTPLRLRGLTLPNRAVACGVAAAGAGLVLYDAGAPLEPPAGVKTGVRLACVAASPEGAIAAFVAAARRNRGLDLIELDLSEGPLAVPPGPAPLDARAGLALAAVTAVRAAWPADRPLATRLGARDDVVALARLLAARGVDLIAAPAAEAETIHHETAVPTLALEPMSADDADTALAAERADLCVIG